MDRTDLVRQLSNLVTQISSASKTGQQALPVDGSATTQTQLRATLMALLSQPQNGQVLARWDPVMPPSVPVIVADPKGEHLVSILLQGQRFLLSTALDLKPGMEVRFSLSGDQIRLQPGSISAPTAQLNAEIQQLSARIQDNAPPPLDTRLLAQPPSGAEARTIGEQLTQVMPLLLKLPDLAQLTQPEQLARWVEQQRPPLAQQLPQQLSTLPLDAAPARTEAPSASAGIDLAARLLAGSASAPVALPLLLGALLQKLAPPTSAQQNPEPQPLTLQLPSFSYAFPQKASAQEKLQDTGTLLKRMAHWLRHNQEQSQLHQLLQLQSSTSADETRPAHQFWLELPFRVDQQLHWLQLHIQHTPDDKQGGTDSRPERQDQVWQLQLRLERPETGAIYASVYFRKPKLDVQFWAEHPHTLRELQAALPGFTDMLKSEGVEECTVAANPGAMQRTTTELDQRRLHLEA